MLLPALRRAIRRMIHPGPPLPVSCPGSPATSSRMLSTRWRAGPSGATRGARAPRPDLLIGAATSRGSYFPGRLLARALLLRRHLRALLAGLGQAYGNGLLRVRDRPAGSARLQGSPLPPAHRAGDQLLRRLAILVATRSLSGSSRSLPGRSRLFPGGSRALAGSARSLLSSRLFPRSSRALPGSGRSLPRGGILSSSARLLPGSACLLVGLAGSARALSAVRARFRRCHCASLVLSAQ